MTRFSIVSGENPETFCEKFLFPDERFVELFYWLDYWFNKEDRTYPFTITHEELYLLYTNSFRADWAAGEDPWILTPNVFFKAIQCVLKPTIVRVEKGQIRKNRRKLVTITFYLEKDPPL
jgi:hypothetical protein